MATITRPDRRRPEPLWHQVEQSIRAAIESGTWKSGARIPGEEVFQNLIEALGDTDWRIRSAAITALGLRGDRRALDAIHQSLVGDSDALTPQRRLP